MYSVMYEDDEIMQIKLFELQLLVLHEEWVGLIDEIDDKDYSEGFDEERRHHRHPDSLTRKYWDEFGQRNKNVYTEYQNLLNYKRKEIDFLKELLNYEQPRSRSRSESTSGYYCSRENIMTDLNIDPKEIKRAKVIFNKSLKQQKIKEKI